MSCCGPVGVAASGSPPFGPRKPGGPSRTRPRTDKDEALDTRPLPTRFRVPLTGAGQRNGGKRMVSAVSQGPQVAYDAAAGLGHTGVCGSEPEAFCLTLGSAHIALSARAEEPGTSRVRRDVLSINGWRHLRSGRSVRASGLGGKTTEGPLFMTEIIELNPDRRAVYKLRKDWRRRQNKKPPVLGEAERSLLDIVINSIPPEEQAELDRIRALADDPKYR